MKKQSISIDLKRAITFGLASILISLPAFAEKKLLKQCYLRDGTGGSSMSVKLYYDAMMFSGFSSLNSVSLQAGKIDQMGKFVPRSNEISYNMKLIQNFHKGAVYNVDIGWPTGNPGSMMYDAGTGSIQIAFYRTRDFGSVAGNGNCNP